VTEYKNWKLNSKFIEISSSVAILWIDIFLWVVIHNNEIYQIVPRKTSSRWKQTWFRRLKQLRANQLLESLTQDTPDVALCYVASVPLGRMLKIWHQVQRVRHACS
jgi:hypothetical protein